MLNPERSEAFTQKKIAAVYNHCAMALIFEHVDSVLMSTHSFHKHDLYQCPGLAPEEKTISNP